MSLSLSTNCESLADINKPENEKLKTKIIDDLRMHEALAAYNKDGVINIVDKIISWKTLEQHEQELLAGLNTSTIKDALVQELSKIDWTTKFGQNWTSRIFTEDGNNISAEKFFRLLLEGKIAWDNETLIKLDEAWKDIRLIGEFLNTFDHLKKQLSAIEKKISALKNEEKISYSQWYNGNTFTKLEWMSWSVWSGGLGVTEEEKQEIIKDNSISGADVKKMLHSDSLDLHNGGNKIYLFRQRWCDGENILASKNIFFRIQAKKAIEAWYTIATEKHRDDGEEAYASAFGYTYEKGENNADTKLAMMKSIWLYYRYMSLDQDERNSRAFRLFYGNYRASIRSYDQDVYGCFLLLKMG